MTSSRIADQCGPEQWMGSRQAPAFEELPDGSLQVGGPIGDDQIDLYGTANRINGDAPGSGFRQ